MSSKRMDFIGSFLRGFAGVLCTESFSRNTDESLPGWETREESGPFGSGPGCGFQVDAGPRNIGLHLGPIQSSGLLLWILQRLDDQSDDPDIWVRVGLDSRTGRN